MLQFKHLYVYHQFEILDFLIEIKLQVGKFRDDKMFNFLIC